MHLLLSLVILTSAATSVSAQQTVKKLAADTWRPKDGIYAETGPDFATRCGEFGDAQFHWKKKRISGGEGGCTITRITARAPGDLRLDVSCTDNQSEKSSKEIILLKKIDETTFFLRETQKGKFSRPGGQFAYCPEENQQAYIKSGGGPVRDQ